MEFSYSEENGFHHGIIPTATIEWQYLCIAAIYCQDNKEKRQ
jgi:hypothetical protein